ncbi:hypothetical protein AMS68_008017 [Peltaster fructicola]|uniref:Glycosyltransferase family 8 protein n=1 Tax=Peltaster fructicola TaxID=286661 RepID=A0A6H0Y7C2_9PEZI|nr:hypothetical protein AMS68_008017 [Peltaster fructicola]
MIIRRSGKTLLVFGAIFSALLILFFVPQTGIKEKSTKIVNDLLASKKNETDKPTWNDDKYYFQVNLPQYELPQFGKVELAAAPQNYKGPGGETIATFYASRDADMHDPYFLAAQQIVYRVLWNPRTKTTKYPMTVFVTPFISQEQRDFFIGAGAIVREVPLRPFVPTEAGAAGRLKDMFTKLEMWYQRDFKRIAYLDSDAFPVDHIDSIFDLVPWQMCKKELLPEGDRSVADDICKYSFGGWKDYDGINAGVMVFNPNEAMFGRLVRESLNQSNFNNGLMEQSLLQYTYNPEGPFPPSTLSHEWNAGGDMTASGQHQYILHSKIWNTGFEAHDTWYYNEFKHMWQDMIDWYKTDQFLTARRESGPKSVWE